ncbi:hypothetical protein SADUNF_Sadunf13G0106900 [Salix dunnii]|uniref:Uncharacterized protein n=1 Tax=Salix dunnii TaxID=1413687 RepID=A0A835MM85_9ROSI|nr:hypothetical protein SADUNF_Sadunf13G0106900 [Salix dunnii]
MLFNLPHPSMLNFSRQGNSLSPSPPATIHSSRPPISDRSFVMDFGSALIAVLETSRYLKCLSLQIECGNSMIPNDCNLRVLKLLNLRGRLNTSTIEKILLQQKLHWLVCYGPSGCLLEHGLDHGQRLIELSQLLFQSPGMSDPFSSYGTDPCQGLLHGKPIKVELLSLSLEEQ